MRRIQGEHLRRLVSQVHQDFFNSPHRAFRSGYVQINSLRVATIETYSRLSIDAQAAVINDLVRSSDELLLQRSPSDIFGRSDTLQAHITDLVCEVVCQELLDDPLVAMESETREALIE